MRDRVGEGVALAEDGDMDEDGELKQESGSSSGSDELIRRTFLDSVVAAVLFGMFFTALVAWSDIGRGDQEICAYYQSGLGFWIEEEGKRLCYFSVTKMITIGALLTVILSPLTFSLSFLVVFVCRSKRNFGLQRTNSKT